MKNTPLYIQIKNTIKGKIVSGELKAGDLVPSEAELMNDFKVSQITAKNALSSLVDEGIIYRIQGKGSFVSQEANISEKAEIRTLNGNKKPNGMIGVLFPYLNTKLEYKLLYHLDRFIYEQGYQMLMHNCNESEKEESQTLKKFLELGVDGLIVFPAVNEQYNENILRLSLDKFPLVLIDRYLKGLNTFHVVSDNFNGTYSAITYLLNKGHRRIAYISPKIINSTTEERAFGYEKAFQDKKLSIDKNLWLTDLDSIDNDKDYNTLLQFYKNNLNITAVFTANVRMLDLTMQALRQLNKKVPEDVEVFTFDEPGYPNVNYVLQDYESIAKEAVNLLMAQKQSSSVTKRDSVIPVNLVFRQSNC